MGSMGDNSNNQCHSSLHQGLLRDLQAHQPHLKPREVNQAN